MPAGNGSAPAGVAVAPYVAPRMAPRSFVAATATPWGCHSHHHSPATCPEGDHRPCHVVARVSCAGASRGSAGRGRGLVTRGSQGAHRGPAWSRSGSPGWPGRAGVVALGRPCGIGNLPAGIGMAPAPLPALAVLAPTLAPGRFLAAIALPHGCHSPNQRLTRAICSCVTTCAARRPARSARLHLLLDAWGRSPCGPVLQRYAR